ncbi:class I SAM-dependent methyltransferase [Campylobacter insulaenigrae]|uniref:class I SAM-dependent methyltransferase n=1 Tax=Campylobacter insulaenigrae TaxID=260714 RepID=UPI002152F951|nr:class I SAM-dependent methyltransferase [Campylobacter insulaenigrae]MCR6577670.1 class I SAM-dependent methyltransferase [Campylobacter insulaenigrae]
MRLLSCPLCEFEQLIELFDAHNAFVSVGELQKEPFQSNVDCGYVNYTDQYCKGELDIKILQCSRCGYIYNSLFDEKKMYEAYSNNKYITPKAISNVMSNFALQLSNKLKRYILEDSVGLEIAPGSCDILNALHSSFKFLYSVDPSCNTEVLLKNYDNIFHIKDFFNYSNIKNKLKHKINFIIFRHLIEHICTPKSFLTDVVSLLENNGIIYIETPNVTEIFSSKRFYELRHEHCGYWNKNTLINVMCDLGCELVEETYFYNRQWFGLIFKKTANKTKYSVIHLYNNMLTKELYEAIAELENILDNYQNIAIYGAGGHANSLITYLKTEICMKIKIAIDKDTRRVGTYLQKSNIEIKHNCVSNLIGIDCVLMVMPCYEQNVFEEEIKKSVIEDKYHGDVILTSKGIKVLKNKEIKCQKKF